MIKRTQLSKQYPTFEEKVLIWTTTGQHFEGVRTRSIETSSGTKHIFQCGEDEENKGTEVDNATHFARINGPKE